MEPLIKHEGLVLPLNRADVDTDQIMPAQFLKRIERTGFGQFLFNSWRRLEDGTPNPDFILNNPKYEGASILVARRNFGCGSSREHAPWALQDHGFRALIAPSFADIFVNNCFQNGLLPVVLDEESVDYLMKKALASPGYGLTVDLENLTVSDSQGFSRTFEVDDTRRHKLLKGLDDIAVTLQLQDKIAAYENRHN